MTTQTRPVKVNKEVFAEDVGNITLLEHVNTQIDDQSVATLFYLVGMGFTRDPHMMVGLENMWINLGEQQFHLPTNHPQVLRGHMGIVTPNLDSLVDRLEGVQDKLHGTKFAFSRKKDHVDVTSPWGNLFRCYEPGPQFGRMRVGMPYVEFTVPQRTAKGIAAFYSQLLGAVTNVVSRKSGDYAEVTVGYNQKLIFRETAGDIPDYDGHHIAIYVANFSEPYEALKKRGLITEEPTSASHQFRFLDIVDPKTGRKLFTIEHEVRSLKHPLFNRDLVNRNVGEFLEPRRMNGRTVLGAVR
jgi:hypothetical protein